MAAVAPTAIPAANPIATAVLPATMPPTAPIASVSATASAPANTTAAAGGATGKEAVRAIYKKILKNHTSFLKLYEFVRNTNKTGDAIKAAQPIIHNNNLLLWLRIYILVISVSFATVSGILIHDAWSTDSLQDSNAWLLKVFGGILVYSILSFIIFTCRFSKRE